MVQLVIQQFDAQDQNHEFVLIELQGSLESTAEQVSGMEIGILEQDDNGNPILIIGQHKLKGTLQQLKKPLAVLHKQVHHSYTPTATPRKKSVLIDVSSPMQSSSLQVYSSITQKYGNESFVGYEIKEVITKKYLFNSR